MSLRVPPGAVPRSRSFSDSPVIFTSRPKFFGASPLLAANAGAPSSRAMARDRARGAKDGRGLTERELFIGFLALLR